MKIRPRLRSLRRHRSGSNERGLQSVEAVVIIPVFLGIIFAIINGAVWMQAGNIAQSAASSAYNAARLYNGTSGDGVLAGEAIANQPGSVLSDVVVSVQRTPATVTVTITGTAPTLVPGFEAQVERTVTGPTERWVNQ